VERNTDGRSFKIIDGERVKVNFLIFYEMFDHAACQDSFARDGAVVGGCRMTMTSEWVLLAGCTTQVVTLWCFNTVGREILT